METKLNKLSDKCYTCIRGWVKDNWYRKLNKSTDFLIEDFLHYGDGQDDYEEACEEYGVKAVEKELTKAITAANVGE